MCQEGLEVIRTGVQPWSGCLVSLLDLNGVTLPLCVVPGTQFVHSLIDKSIL
jgi:hypothetical protein